MVLAARTRRSVVRPLPALLIALPLLLPSFAGAATTGRGRLTRELDAYMQPLVDRDLVSGCVLVARRGEVLVNRAYGPADREHGVPLRPSARFRIGSLSKQFTAAAILLLEQRGKLDIEAPLARYLPDFPHADSLTLHQLLTHTSGLANFNELPDYGERYVQPLSTAEVVEWFKAQPRIGTPGEKWAYSNSNYILLAAVIEKVSGKPFATFLHDELFAPLGMNGTGVDIYEDVLGERAEGYVRDWTGVHRTPYRNMALMNGAGSIVSTVGDLLRWDRALRTEVPLGSAARQKLFTPVQAAYACGWFTEPRFGHRLIAHSGAINGFLAELQRFVDDDVTVIVLLNYESTFGKSIQLAVGAMALGEPYRPALIPDGVPVPAPVLASAAATYRVDAKTTLTLTPASDEPARGPARLRVELTGAAPCVAIAQTDSTWFAPDLNAMLRLARGPDGRVVRVIARQGAHAFQATREGGS
jgi:CubicO group peptidase (beta-lactamase class C family)